MVELPSFPRDVVEEDLHSIKAAIFKAELENRSAIKS